MVINPFTPTDNLSCPNTIDGRVYSVLKGLTFNYTYVINCIEVDTKGQIRDPKIKFEVSCGMSCDVSCDYLLTLPLLGGDSIFLDQSPS